MTRLEGLMKTLQAKADGRPLMSRQHYYELATLACEEIERLHLERNCGTPTEGACLNGGKQCTSCQKSEDDGMIRQLQMRIDWLHAEIKEDE